MKTQATTHVIAVVSALTLSALGIPGAKAETADVTNALIYNNRAYGQDMGYRANSAPAQKVENAEIIYVNNAYGPAIYSYPSNNPKHHLELVDKSRGTDRNAVPATLTSRSGTGWVSETNAKP